jgi:biotin-dependent carboxylase-like uncharacterized protein
VSVRIGTLIGSAAFQDSGRLGYRKFGVPPGGAFDRASALLANLLVRNEPGTPTIEMALGSAEFEAIEPVELSWAGAVGPIFCDGRRLGCPESVELAPGQALRFEAPTRGARIYLAVRGGWRTRKVLGSASGTAVSPGDTLQVAEAPPVSCGGQRRVYAALPGDPATLEILPGPQADRLDLRRFLETEYTVSIHSDRVGIRLSGPLLPTPDEIPSEPCCVGAIQITREGLPIILGPDGPTIGGYPKVAVVVDSHLDRVAQFTPGCRVRFALRGA